ncbi:hypothetical protein CBR_g26393 [Chara braunii]|uniref:Amine oxidase domain-containing protein n=1 Tax=Chara braunii TaxID=69332 RepID=A0A388L7X3_CHABU|nr:hypothetical protein CBR_g26393 [Chara braunii]|eukprot:GBG78364.1 hypothetical protein CBR_g26393 [Chara braunii]
MESLEYHDVVVIGAGIAGLEAARSLRKLDPSISVLVVEASDRIGGRVEHIDGIAPYHIELGPEFLHGANNSSMFQLSKAMGCRLHEYAYPDRFYFGAERRMVKREELDADAEVARVHELFANLADEAIDQYTGENDTSVADYLRRKGVKESMMKLADALYANDFGCSLTELGVAECIQEARSWSFGDSYFILDRPVSSIIQWLAEGTNIRLLWPVAAIDYSLENAVRVASVDGRALQARRVIVTVPITILRDGDIQFSPALPLEKLRMIQSINMSNAMKVVMAFSERFWPEDLFDVVCTDCFLPEIWMTSATLSRPAPPSSSLRSFSPLRCPSSANLGKVAVVGFVAGERAKEMSQFSHDKIFRKALSQLDEMFGKATDCAMKQDEGEGLVDLEGTHSLKRRDDSGKLVTAGTQLMQQDTSSTARIREQQTVHASHCTSVSRAGEDYNKEQEDEEASAIADNHGEMVGGRLWKLQKSETNSGIHFSQRHNPASWHFAGGLVKDWSKEPFIRGGYSHPSKGAQGARASLTMPVLQRLFFAGEATHEGVNPCLQAAIDTGRRAANQVFDSLIQKPMSEGTRSRLGFNAC